MTHHRDGANFNRALMPTAKGALGRLFAKFRYSVGGNHSCRWTPVRRGASIWRRR